ncbi:DNA-binding response regulator [Rhodococcus sp. WS1]|jgi:DNA-binding response OmpR family regulator|uniref:DNA-binding response regulator n=2 Tax=Rhodococcus erythropolis TaxID=1833 RepID=A0A5N5E6N7_RHOER|nr:MULTISPECIES: response regulator transcription factor [Rhodococcus]MCD2153200.1 response regulator transcription factor [Rhodococcus cerastii]MCW0191855.1 response regulator transcription factor [Rhodococcus sp. (in: high G+C Gram-positive bacteria)]AKD98952.1 chemotaxis protein CheY [Rhodococcus erythropolis]ATI31945.1 DNA-binding response regulator [Rhodococcus sp. H-CA8f]KAB2586139.1 DNA-binding response regulator [Rhodococcus erythropolis]
MSQRRVLVVDDEVSICESIAARLRAEGYDVELAFDGPSAVTRCEQMDADLVVLDVMMPGFDGLEVCRRIQAVRPVPVLMLTARADETDMLIGLGVGADDYLSKPFSMRVLVARVQALLRRADRAEHAARPVADLLEFGDVVIDLTERRVRRDTQEVHLTRTEFDLIAYLAERPRAAIPRESLLEEIWGWGEGAGSRTVDSHVKALRRKLGPSVIRTVHGVGYAWDVPR